jgi:hypothetical protein
MRVIALIEDADVIRRILRHMGFWAPEPVPKRDRSPPATDPPAASLDILTYHPVPDIA